jgi:hypothetical protein
MDLGKDLGRNSSVKGDIRGPEYLGIAFGPESSAVSLPDGAVRFFYTDKTAKPSNVYSRTSRDFGKTWEEPVLEFRTPAVPYPESDSTPIDTQTWYSTASLVDADGEIHVMFQVYYGAGTIGISRFMDVYHIKTRDRRTAWSTGGRQGAPRSQSRSSQAGGRSQLEFSGRQRHPGRYSRTARSTAAPASNWVSGIR